MNQQGTAQAVLEEVESALGDISSEGAPYEGASSENARRASATVLAEQATPLAPAGEEELVAVRIAEDDDDYELIPFSELRVGDYYLPERTRGELKERLGLKRLLKYRMSARMRRRKRVFLPLFLGGIGIAVASFTTGIALASGWPFLFLLAGLPAALVGDVGLAYDVDVVGRNIREMRNTLNSGAVHISQGAEEGLAERILNDHDLVTLGRIANESAEIQRKAQKSVEFLAERANPLGRDSVEKRLAKERRKLESLREELRALALEEEGVTAVARERAAGETDRGGTLGAERAESKSTGISHGKESIHV